MDTFFLADLPFAGLQLVEEGVQALEVAFPKAPVSLQPNLKLLERLGPQGVNPALRVDANVNQPGITEHAQVFGDLRLAETQAADHVPDGPRAVTQELDDQEAVGFGERSECCHHGGV